MQTEIARRRYVSKSDTRAACGTRGHKRNR